MASFRLRRERPSRTGAIAAVSAGSIAAGAALFYFLDPRRGAERRERAGQLLHDAPARAGDTARELGERASRTLRESRERMQHGVKEATERAKGAADEVRSSAAQGQQTLAARGAWTPETLQGAAGGVLVARALFGGGLMRIPAGLIGISILGKLAARSDTLHKGVARTRDAARTAADRIREAQQGAGVEGERTQGGQAQGGAHGGERQHTSGAGTAGGARREPEVREVKTPSELEPGMASGRPDPTFRDRVDRGGPHMGGRGGGGRGGYDAAAGGPADLGEDGGFLAPGTDDVTRTSGFDAPEAGASIREGDLGAVMPPDEDGYTRARRSEDEDEGAPRILAPDEGAVQRLSGPDEGGASRIVAPDEANANPSARIVGPDERPAGSGLSLDEAPAGRIAGSDDVNAADRREAGEADAARRDPSVDGG